MAKAVRLEYLIYGEYDQQKRWYVMEVFETHPAPPMHPQLTDSHWSKIRNDVPDWVQQRCYFDEAAGIFENELPIVLPPPIKLLPRPIIKEE
ncbi:MAG TPA: hypothetical protein PK803_05120 [Alphaproteobacteria bacterium]|nr:hypothetical protein [Alphaproteobacteria bacterium]